MTEDIQRRLSDFSEGVVQVKRLALTMDQVNEHNPPPNPAKVTDSRADSYIEKYGEESWELDALPPAVLVDLVRTAINGIRNKKKWDAEVKKQETQRAQLTTLSAKWPEVAKTL